MESVLTFSGLAFTRSSYAGATCTSTGRPISSTSQTMVIGAEVTATLGGASVTAFQVDVTGGILTTYDLAYVDTTVTPPRLHWGSTTGASNGSTAALRPTTLDAAYYEKQ